MTIRLLCAYDKYPANAIVTLDAGTEAGLVAARMASTNTTGGTPYVPPVQPNQLRPANLVYDATGTLLGLAGPNNTIISIGGSSATAPGQPAKPVLTAMAGAVSLAWTPGADGSTATTGNVWTDINGNTTALTTNPQVITAPAGTPYTGTLKTQNAQGFGPASVQADAVTPTAASSMVGFAATGGRIGYNTADPTLAGGTRYCYTVRAPIEITADTEYLELHFDNKYFQGTTLMDNTSNRELVAYALEKIDGSAYVPFKFNGANSASIAPGAHLVADRLQAAAFGLSKFTKGDRYFLRLKERVSGTGKHILSSFAATVDSSVIATSALRSAYYDEATEAGVTIYGTGAIPAQPNQFTTGASHPFPQAIVGKYVNSGELSAAAVGDSIDWGFSDTVTTQITGRGYFDRAAVDGTGKTVYSSMNLAIPGSSVATQNIPLINYYLQFANVVLFGTGVNDLGLGGTPNVATASDGIVAHWAVARAAGVKRLLKRGLMPVTNSAGGNWISKADQTPYASFAAGSYGDQFETRQRSYIGAANGIHAYWNARANISDPTDDHYWLTDGTTNKKYVSDGVHPGPLGNATMITSDGGLQPLILAQKPFL